MQFNAPSRAKQYFDKIKSSAGAAFLREMIDHGTAPEEHEFLDFKSGKILANREELRSSWAKNLSCFANSDGGVIIFGIEEKDNMPKEIVPVSDLAKLKKELTSFLGVATEPPVRGVEIETFEDESGSNKGFVVCLIPASPFRPHQAKAGKHSNRFFLRAGDSCQPCGVETLRALFAPQSRSWLRLTFSLTSNNNGPNGATGGLLNLALENLGPGTASDVCVTWQWSQAQVIQGDYVWPRDEIWKIPTPAHPYLIIATRPIHPEQNFDLLQFDFKRIDRLIEPMEFKFSISARDQLPIKYAVSLMQADFLSRRHGIAKPVEATVPNAIPITDS